MAQGQVPQYDVIVVGGGLAGTQAALSLKEKGKKVLLLEARDRFGGRTLATTVDGYVFDLGGQWVGGTHDLLRNTLARYGIKTFTQFDEGKHVLEINGTTQFYSGNISTLNNRNLDGLFRAIDIIDKLAQELDPAHPERHPMAHKWDSMTVADWTTANAPERDAKAIIDWFVRVCIAFEPFEISFLYLLLFIRAAGNYALLADIRGGAQQDRIIGGSQQVSERIADAVSRDSYRLNSPVSAVHYTDTHVVVQTAAPNPAVYTAKYLVLAIPPTLAGRIQYSPPLPSGRDELTQRLAMGTVIKTITIYDEPFWRQQGFSAEAISDQGPIFICYDDTSHDSKKFAIVGFIAATSGRQWGLRTPEERKQAVLECYARWWGPKALTPKHFLEKDWKQEEWSRGCYVGVAGPGVLSELAQHLRSPVGRIHWAGTETATKWIGYMEGALESGLRAAGEVNERLQRESSRPSAKL